MAASSGLDELLGEFKENEQLATSAAQNVETTNGDQQSIGNPARENDSGGEEGDYADHPLNIPPNYRELNSIIQDEEQDSTLTPPTRQLESILHGSNQGKSKKGATKTALKWFNNFLREYWRDPRRADRKPDVDLVGCERLYDYLTDNNLDLDLMGTFCTYLVKTPAGNCRTGFLSWNSANSYLGQVISYHTDRNARGAVGLSGNKIMEVFGDGRFLSKSRSQMQKRISERSKDHGIPLVVAKSGATEQDWKLIAMSAVLIGGPSLAEFWAISVAMTHFASRGNETSYLQFMHGSCVDINEVCGGRNKTGIFEMNNFKQGGTFQEMHVFPHYKDWYRDFYFSCAYYFALANGCDSPYLFPKFAREANKCDSDGVNDSSGVSSLWKKTMSFVCEFLEKNPMLWKKLVDAGYLPFVPGLETPELTKDICMHSPRKFGVYEMGKTCTALYIIFRAGWKIENAHTIFDYLIRAAHYDVKAAKACAGWTIEHGSQIWGGYNNELSDIPKNDLDKFETFSQKLFRFQEKRMNRELRHLHTFSVLRFYEAFTRFLQDSEYSGKHLFVERVQISLSEAGVDTDTFQNWQKEIKINFKRQNYFGMHLGDLNHDFKVDSRGMLDRVQAMEFALVSLTTENTKLQKEVGDLRSEIVDLRSSQQTMIRLQNSIFDLLQQKGSPNPGSPNRAVSVSSDEEGSDSESPTQIQEYQGSYPSPWPEQRRLAKDIVYNMDHYQGSIPCKAIFKLWFADQLPVRWENLLTSPTVSREKSRNARNQFSSFKTVVHVLLKHLPAYPTVEDDLDDLARTAMTNLMIDHGMDPLRDDEPNRSKIAGGSKKRVNGKSVAVESLFSSGNYQTRAFPDGTPDCIRSFFENRGNNPIAGKKRALGDIE